MVYSNCDLLPISLFYKILKTSDYTLLYKNYDNLKDKPTIEKCSDLWLDIYDEYVSLVNDETVKYYYELEKLVMYLTKRYEVAFFMLKQLSEGLLNNNQKIAYVEELRKWSYNINLKNNLDTELDNAVRQLKSSKNKINIKKNELEQMRQNMQKDSDSMTLIEQATRLEHALNRSANIDIHNTVVSKWVVLVKILEETNRAKRKENGK
jgi:hypothetical protein